MDTNRSIVEVIETTLTKQHDVRLYVKRDDLIDDKVSGNKWRKLKYFVAQFREKRNEGILTFGGAYSNHLLATAAYCAQESIPAVGIVRGDELTVDSNETLRECAQLGMKLKFVSREEYLIKDDRSYKEYLIEEFPNYMIVPEGGSGYMGMLGCQEIVAEVRATVAFEHIFVAQGTTTTSCGVLMGLRGEEKLDVVPVLKGFPSLSVMRDLFKFSAFDSEYIDELLSNVTVHSDYHFGGYGKVDVELLNFIRSFYQETKLKLDPIYTGKAMYALMEMVKSGELDGKTVVFLHTGGLQGARSIEEKYGTLY